MARYFLTLSYLGTRYSGWQVQPNANAVQAEIELALSTFFGGSECAITGCGRTDAGVHARNYVAHFDTDRMVPDHFLKGINSILPKDIAIHQITPMPVWEDAESEPHARYSAFERSYEYHITTRKDPFSLETAWYYPQASRLDTDAMQHTAALLLQYDAFFPFCKTDSGADHYRCAMKQAVWELQPDTHRFIFHITANRFLRGMVRLIVGACIQVGNGLITVAEIKNALDLQQPLKKSLSVPPQGLFLTDIRYPFPI